MRSGVGGISDRRVTKGSGRDSRRYHDPLAWSNFPVAALFFVAMVGIPLRMVLRSRGNDRDFSEARAYLDAKAAMARGEQPVRIPPVWVLSRRRHPIATRPAVPDRGPAGPAMTLRHRRPATTRRRRAST